MTGDDDWHKECAKEAHGQMKEDRARINSTINLTERQKSD
jgi:hypothetical protein